MPVKCVPIETMTTEQLQDRRAKLISQRDAIDAELSKVRAALNQKVADTYHFVRFDEMKSDKLTCIKALREAAISAGRSYGLKEAKDLCDFVGMGQPQTLEFPDGKLTDDLVTSLNRHFVCTPVAGY